MTVRDLRRHLADTHHLTTRSDPAELADLHDWDHQRFAYQHDHHDDEEAG